MFFHGLPSITQIDLKQAADGRQPSHLADLEQLYHEELDKVTPERIQTLLRDPN